MRKKTINKKLSSNNPMNAIFNTFSPRQRAVFMRFAGAFGYTEEMIKNLLKDERDGKHIN